MLQNVKDKEEQYRVLARKLAKILKNILYKT